MKFLLDTDKVSGVSDSIANCVKGAQYVLDSVNGYDVSCAEFDFAGAKAKIASNVSSFVTRIQNTSNAINGVIECHTALQNIDLDAKTEDEKKKKDTSPGSSSDSSSSSSGSPYRSSNSSSSFTHAFHVEKKKKNEEEELQNKLKIIEENDDKKEYKPNIKSVSYAIVNKDKTTAESKKVLDKVTTTDANGYMMIGNRYVIACDESIGKVGDVIRFTSSDNKVVECVVAITTVAAANTGKVFVLVDDKQTEIKAADFADTIVGKGTKIENLSSKQSYTPQMEKETAGVSGKLKEGLSNAINEQDSDSNKAQEEGTESSVVEENTEGSVDNATNAQESDSNKVQEEENKDTDEKKPDASELFENGDGINA
ncbi:MAG: hypothetical protein IKE63_05545 [Bacilli bacterium]|nr:hypothetical protein [Bacilli bacterium]